MSVARSHLLRIVLAAAVMFVAAAGGAWGRGGGDREARVHGVCGRGATQELRVRSRDDGLRVRLEIHARRAGVPWRIVLIQDRRIVWRGRVLTRGAAPSFEIERHLRDLPGADQVTARAWGPAGVTCAATATLPG